MIKDLRALCMPTKRGMVATAPITVHLYRQLAWDQYILKGKDVSLDTKVYGYSIGLAGILLADMMPATKEYNKHSSNNSS